MKGTRQHLRPAIWCARIALSLVFIINVHCALLFLFTPGPFVGAYELSGHSGAIALQGLGVAFLMWNVTYPFAIADPIKNRIIFIIVLLQQTVGLVGESWILFSLESGHTALHQSILRFIIFDGVGLIIMLAAYIFLTLKIQQSQRIP